jgi:hypothetical protein
MSSSQTDLQITTLESPAVRAAESDSPAISLSDAQRRRLADLADQLIAGGVGFPSASKAEVHLAWIDRALAARPDLARVVTGVIDAEGEPADVIEHLRTTELATFGDFAFIVSGAYLINPRIRQLLGYPAAQPAKNPAFPDEAEAYLEDGILDRVIERGPIYRPTPD